MAWLSEINGGVPMMRKIGGITFFRFGRSQFQFCRVKRPAGRRRDWRGYFLRSLVGLFPWLLAGGVALYLDDPLLGWIAGGGLFGWLVLFLWGLKDDHA